MCYSSLMSKLAEIKGLQVGNITPQGLGAPGNTTTTEGCACFRAAISQAIFHSKGRATYVRAEGNQTHNNDSGKRDVRIDLLWKRTTHLLE
jgi:hypothetical protein